MKRGILNAERTIFEIQHTLLTDPVISKLIYYDTPDALHREPVEDVELLKDSVLTKPI